ncbi:uncharacterized protein LOC119785517 [Cyprinodon tularosa]|uniref:uncharacterized protein LOC119785517 n=1 Tax=Cyprinodon tularosa TaxID=77115 RepID=UPI0018E2606C|nr:uncharacterized protein LOC119785517 [Cyprinodon tularosa]
MVVWQLATLQHLNNSGFGRPFPRHGLQLLFWFSNHCVSFELDNSVDIMKLVSECQPEKGVYGFHKFGNVEELLPVLIKPKKQKSTRQLVYFVVGNLNTLSYPESADLPAFVRENHGADRSSNSDRLIISCQVKTRVVEKVYVTEHDDGDLGRFRSDGTHEVSPELIRVLQNPELDLSFLLTQIGYYDDVEMLQDTEENDPSGLFCEAFSYQLNSDQFRSNISTDGSVVCYNSTQKKKKKKSKRKQKPLNATSCQSDWELRYEDYYDDYRTSYSSGAGYGAGYGGSYGAGYGAGYGSGGGGGFSKFLKTLFKVAAIYLAAKCFSWLIRKIWSANWGKQLLHFIPGGTPGSQSYPRAHAMLDYVY